MASLPHANHHIQKPSLYWTNFVALIILMGLTIFIGEHPIPNIGPFNGTMLTNLAAMGIAVLKAFLVATIFMGLWFSSGLIKIYAILGFVWVSLMTIMFCDYATRQFEPNPSWEKTTDSAMPCDRLPAKPYQSMPVEGSGKPE